jgi:haloalkane dehalogenase
MTSWLDPTLYPFTPRRFSTSDGTMSYVDHGAGPPLLLVHGTPSWSFEFRAVIAQLGGQYRCVAPDHLGFGLSDKPRAAPLDPAAHTERLVQLVQALDLRDITLVVHDFGGPIGLGAAQRLPERIKRIVVANSWLWPNADTPALVKLGRMIEGPIGRFLYRFLNFSPRVLLPAMFGDRRTLTRAVHRQYLGPFGRRAEREGPYQMARALLGADAFYAKLWAARDVLAPKLTDFVWGEKDPAFKAEHLQRWLAAFPAASVQRLPRVGHFVAEEAPDALVAVLRGGRDVTA